jgi:hypothetical protein
MCESLSAHTASSEHNNQPEFSVTEKGVTLWSRHEYDYSRHTKHMQLISIQTIFYKHAQMELPAAFSFWVFVSGETEDEPFKPVDILWHDMIYDKYLTAIGLTPGGSSTVRIYTQSIHRRQRTEHM